MNELIIVLGSTYQLGTGGRSIQWHKTFGSIEEFISWEKSRTLDYDDSYEVYKGYTYYNSVSHGSLRKENV